MRKYFVLSLWIVIITFFFRPIFTGRIPAPLDTVVGMYHPWRDVIWNNFSAGVPFKNFLITDPVRQQIPWKLLVIDNFKSGNLNSWNRYSFSGTPLSANIQAGAFYPGNILFYLFSAPYAWFLYITLAVFMAGIFSYLYLKNLGLTTLSCIFSSITFVFGSFFICWLEWGNIPHVILWLPLVLLSIDKLVNKITFRWAVIFILSQTCQLLAGHLQFSFYLVVFSCLYLSAKLFNRGFLEKSINNRQIISKILVFLFLFAVSFWAVWYQYKALLELILASARTADLPNWQAASWFLPPKHLVQLIAPDFFGNPTTQNYFGEWNYGELTIYIGLLPLIFSFYSLFHFRNKYVKFFTICVVACFILILPNFISQIPFVYQWPFLKTAQPTRLIFIIAFTLSVLAGFGLNYYQKTKQSKQLVTIYLFCLFILFVFGLLTILPVFKDPILTLNLQTVTRRNLIIPLLILFLSMFAWLTLQKNKTFFIVVVLLLTLFDLFRFSYKFLSFSNVEWFYPTTPAIEYLKSQIEPYRIMSLDRRIMPSNFSILYRIEEVGGYDPIYLKNYARLVSAWERNKPDINIPAYNRIISPTNYESFITDILNVKYILSLTEIKSSKLELLKEFGQIKLYENKTTFPRYYLVNKAVKVNSPQEEIENMFLLGDKLNKTAVSSETINIDQQEIEAAENISIQKITDNVVILKVNTRYNRLLVTGDIYYPTWQIYLDGVKSKIYQVNLAFRGVVIPPGAHKIEFKYGN